MTTPKDKALEIYNSFFPWMDAWDASHASYICVQYLLKEEMAYRNEEDVEEYYYQEVLEELKKM